MIRLALLLAGFLQAAPRLHAQATQSDVQAVYLYNFARFVHWPATAPGDTLDICIAGQKSYEDSLQKIVNGEKVNGRSFAIHHIERPEDETSCNILFVGASMKDHLTALLAPAAGKPVLTVSDIPGSLSHGVMIQFFVIDNRVRFAVNLTPAASNNISLSSELLKVAVSVAGKPGGTP